MDESRSEDQALLARVADSDRVALELLYRRHAPWLTGRLESRCGDPELVDTAIQDTFLAVWKSARKYRGDGDVSAWLWGIAIRRLIDQLRKRKAQPMDPAMFAVGREYATDAASTGPEAEMLSNTASGDVFDALDRLPPQLRAVLVATAIDGLTTKEAAKLLGVPQGTVKTRLMRARRDVREQLAYPKNAGQGDGGAK